MRTCTAPSVSFQSRVTRSSDASAAATFPWRAASSRACAASRPSPSRKASRRVSPGRELNRDLEAGAGIEPRPEPLGERRVAQRRRRAQGRRCAPGRRRDPRWRSAAARWRGEGHPAGPLVAPGIGGQHRPGFLVELRDHVELLPLLRRPRTHST